MLCSAAVRVPWKGFPASAVGGGKFELGPCLGESGDISLRFGTENCGMGVVPTLGGS